LLLVLLFTKTKRIFIDLFSLFKLIEIKCSLFLRLGLILAKIVEPKLFVIVVISISAVLFVTDIIKPEVKFFYPVFLRFLVLYFLHVHVYFETCIRLFRSLAAKLLAHTLIIDIDIQLLSILAMVLYMSVGLSVVVNIVVSAGLFVIIFKSELFLLFY